ncbi:MAG: amidohydrolase family protein [Desulfatibacillaceae bacterium]|nr:amidohydrolase family protein [Desulfatibacillaceae bacterium]
MNRRKFLKLSLAAASIASAPALLAGCSTKTSIPKMDASRPLIIKNALLVDVEKGAIVQNASVVVEKGIIRSVWRDEGFFPSGAQTLDLGGRYLMPGLIDGHCHSTSSAGFGISTFEAWRHLMQLRRNYEACIRTGVTTIRDTGAFPGLLHGFIKEMEVGTLNGPRIVFCNSITNNDGGHPDVPASQVNRFAGPTSYFIGPMMLNYKNTDELVRTLHSNCAQAHFLKLTVDDESILCGKSKIPVYPDGDLNLMFDFAQRRNMPVACHCMTGWGFDRMMKYPINSLEHLVCDIELSDRQIQTAADKKISVVPTFSLAQIYLIEEAYPQIPPAWRDSFLDNELVLRREHFKNIPADICDPAIHADNMATLEQYRAIPCKDMFAQKIFLPNAAPFFGMAKVGRKNMMRLKQAGVLMGAGMDAGVPLSYFGFMHRELEILVRAGFSPAEAIQCATINNARIINMEDRLGSIKEGKYADMVILAANPLENVKNIQNPLLVIKEGDIRHSSKALTRKGENISLAS